MNYRLRFWAEVMEPPEIVESAFPLLKEFKAGVAVAVYPVSLTKKNASAFRKLLDAGIELTYWPLMEKEQGYFPGERNVDEYAAMVRHLVEWAEKNEVAPGRIAVDLEPPIQQLSSVLAAQGGVALVRSAVSAARENLDRGRYYRAKAILDELNYWVRERGIKTLAAVMPWVALELEGEYELIQDMSDTPAAGIEWDVLSPMLYVTMLAGTPGASLNTRDANWLIYDSCLKLRAKYGERAGVSLGLTGTGILDNEPVFQSPGDLLVGLRAALAAGVRDISIYSLEGIMNRAEPRGWFAAIRDAEPRLPERSQKIARSLSAVRYVYPTIARVVDWYRRPP